MDISSRARSAETSLSIDTFCVVLASSIPVSAAKSRITMTGAAAGSLRFGIGLPESRVIVWAGLNSAGVSWASCEESSPSRLRRWETVFSRRSSLECRESQIKRGSGLSVPSISVRPRWYRLFSDDIIYKRASLVQSFASQTRCPRNARFVASGLLSPARSAGFGGTAPIWRHFGAKKNLTRAITRCKSSYIGRLQNSPIYGSC